MLDVVKKIVLKKLLKKKIIIIFSISIFAIILITSLILGAISSVGAMLNTTLQAGENYELVDGGVETINPNIFYSPMIEGYVTSEFGKRYSPINGQPQTHLGIDLSYFGVVPIFAAANGTVTSTGYSSSMGYFVVIQHFIVSTKYTTVYMHLQDEPFVQIMQVVDVNTQLGIMGSTGHSTGPHLHFEIQIGWNGNGGARPVLDPQNPRLYLQYPDIMVYWKGR